MNTKDTDELRDEPTGHWYMEDRYNEPYIAHCACGYASRSVEVIKGHVKWKLAELGSNPEKERK